MSLPNDTVTNDVEQVLLEDPVVDAGANSIERTSDEGWQ